MRSEPQQDLAVLAPRTDFYRHKHVAPEDVLLLVDASACMFRGWMAQQSTCPACSLTAEPDPGAPGQFFGSAAGLS